MQNLSITKLADLHAGDRILSWDGRPYRPARIATQAYDAVALAAALSRNEGAADFSRAALTNPSGFAGTDGIFRFLSNGVSERGLAVLEVTARGPRVVDAAAQTFLPVTN